MQRWAPLPREPKDFNGSCNNTVLEMNYYCINYLTMCIFCFVTVSDVQLHLSVLWVGKGEMITLSQHCGQDSALCFSWCLNL